LLVSILPRHPEFAGDKVFMDEILGVAWMRRGELENCAHNRNAETCIFPLSKAAMKLYRNDGKGGFQDVTKEVGLDRVVPTMGANFGDLDNDGFLDFYLGTGAPSYAALMPNFMFRNRGGKNFVDVTATTGTGHLQKGHGVAFGDPIRSLRSFVIKPAEERRRNKRK
jgi:hypothetical protein